MGSRNSKSMLYFWNWWKWWMPSFKRVGPQENPQQQQQQQQNVGQPSPYPSSSTSSSSSSSNAPSQVVPKEPPKPVPVPVFCARNVSDLPNVIEKLNKHELNQDPLLSFSLAQYDSVEDNNKFHFAIVLAICATDRVDIVDKELVSDLREKKGFGNVILFVLRRGNDPSKFKSNRDNTIDSGVGSDKVIMQLIYFKGEVLDHESNNNEFRKFFQLAKQAFL